MTPDSSATAITTDGAQPTIGTRAEWLTARLALLQEEKDLTRRHDEIARRRRALPWVRVDAEYAFDTVEGRRSLSELFDGRSQLMIYHFMFGPDWEEAAPVAHSGRTTSTASASTWRSET